MDRALLSYGRESRLNKSVRIEFPKDLLKTKKYQVYRQYLRFGSISKTNLFPRPLLQGPPRLQVSGLFFYFALRRFNWLLSAILFQTQLIWEFVKKVRFYLFIYLFSWHFSLVDSVFFFFLKSYFFFFSKTCFLTFLFFS